MLTIFIVWVVSILLCISISWGARRIRRPRTLRAFHADENGAAYTLTYVMVIPIYLVAFCFVVETTFMMVAKLGTNYASFAAARTAIVWLPFGGEEKIELAAKRAFVPFASGIQPSRSGRWTESSDRQEYLQAYRKYCQQIGVPTNYLQFIARKYDYSHEAIRASTKLTDHVDKWDEDISVTVHYEYPFSVPLVGRLMGRHKAGDRFVYDIQSTSTLQVENPQNDEKSLGIDYVPR